MFLPVIVVGIALWLWRRRRLAFDWNPVDWFESAYKTASGIVSQIVNWVTGIILDAVNLVENDVQSVWRAAQSWLNDLEGFANSINNWAHAALDQLGSWADWAWNDAKNFATGIVNQLGSWAQWAWNDAKNFATGIVNATRDFLVGFGWQIFNTAHQWVSDALSWAGTQLANLSAWVGAKFAETVTWVGDELDRLWHDLYTTIYRDLIKPIEDVIDVVKKAWDWIWWFATHPFALVHDVENDVIDWTAHLPEEIAEVVNGGEFRKGLEAAGRFFGG